jgi:inosine/xanthosine triphosphatase
MKIAVSSENPVKIEAVRSAFEKIFSGKEIKLTCVSVESGVGSQPMSNKETLQGAENRAKNVLQAFPESDFAVGIEGGVHFYPDSTVAFAWMVICSKEKTSKSRTSTFELSPKIAVLLKEGYELGDADDMIFKEKNSKQKNGAVGLLTNNVITRKELYEQALILALIPHIHPGLY